MGNTINQWGKAWGKSGSEKSIATTIDKNADKYKGNKVKDNNK